MATNFYGTRNNVSTTVATGGYTAGAGSLLVVNGSGFLYADGSAPSATKPIVISTFLANGTPQGIYRCEARSGNTLTLTSLLSGTDASLAAGDTVIMNWCKEHADQIAAAVNANETAIAALQTNPGTVTSVALAMPGVIFNTTVPGSPVTTSGTLAPTLATQVANRVLAGPASGGDATPTFRALVAADIPAITAAPGGANTQLQFNDAGVLAGISALTWTKPSGPFSVAADLLCTSGFFVRAGFFCDGGNAKGYIQTSTSGINFQVFNRVTTNIPMVIKAISGQTADQFQSTNSSNVVNFGLDKLGRPYTAINAPTIAAGAGAGTSPTVSIAGTDVSGTITITTGTAPSANAIVATVTFSAAYAAIPKGVLITPANSNAAAALGTTAVYEDQASRSSSVFVLKVAGATGLSGSTTYLFSYRVDG